MRGISPDEMPPHLLSQIQAAASNVTAILNRHSEIQMEVDASPAKSTVSLQANIQSIYQEGVAQSCDYRIKHTKCEATRKRDKSQTMSPDEQREAAQKERRAEP